MPNKAAAVIRAIATSSDRNSERLQVDHLISSYGMLKLLAIICAMSTASAVAVEPLDPAVAAPCFEKQWFAKHDYLTALVLRASRYPPVDVYFLGDSITEFWPDNGKAVWDAEFGKLHVLNCGVSGDTTQNILYRITHGEFDRIGPKVVVLLAGINNLGSSPTLQPDDLTKGLQKIVAVIRSKSPVSKIIVVSIFPSGQPSDPIRQRIVQTNKRLALLADNATIFFLDLYGAFLDSGGNFPTALSPDGTHPNVKGYRVWADRMHPLLQTLLRSEE